MRKGPFKTPRRRRLTLRDQARARRHANLAAGLMHDGRPRNPCGCWRGCIKCGRRGIKPEIVAAMYADYQTGMSFAAVGRKYGKLGQSVRDDFERRGFKLRPVAPAYLRTRRLNGGFMPLKPKNAGEISKIISRMKRIYIPDEIKSEFRHWSVEKRMSFIRRLRARLPDRMPRTPYSSNVKPFDYGTPEAHEIAARINGNLSSQNRIIKIRLSSRGVIWNGQLWSWADARSQEHSNGYVQHDRSGRRHNLQLHHVIWEKHHSRKVPAAHVVVFEDGNRNNFDPSNLVLKHRRDIARQNHFSGNDRTTRAGLGVLLNHFNRNRNQPTQILHEQTR